MHVTHEGQDLLDKFQAAELLDLNPRTVTNKAAKGEIPGMRRTGRREWFFRRSELEEWKRQQTPPEHA